MESVGRELVGEEKWEQIYPLQQVWLQETASDFDPTEVSEEPEANVRTFLCFNPQISPIMLPVDQCSLTETDLRHKLTRTSSASDLADQLAEMASGSCANSSSAINESIKSPLCSQDSQIDPSETTEEETNEDKNG